jgi:hypothetical protein
MMMVNSRQRRRATPRDPKANHTQQVTTSADKAPTQFFDTKIRAKDSVKKRAFFNSSQKSIAAGAARPCRNIQRKRLSNRGFL